MDSYIELQGTFHRGTIAELLAAIRHRNMDCLLQVEHSRYGGMIRVDKQMVVQVVTDTPEYSLKSYIARTGSVSEETLDTISRQAGDTGAAFRRQVLEEKLLNYRELWELLVRQARDYLNQLFSLTEGDYRIAPNPPPLDREPLLAEELTGIIMRGVREGMKNMEIRELISGTGHLYFRGLPPDSVLPLHPYEKHIMKLMARTSNLQEVIRGSELPTADTWRVLYLLRLLGVISREKKAKSSVPEGSSRKGIRYQDFSEVLDTYNQRYILVYKYLYKEIGPVAYSVLAKAVDHSRERLPGYLHRVQLKKNGGINRERIMKDIWYYNFNDIIRELIAGLEELLRAQIFIVQQHVEHIRESKILEWIEN